MCDAATATPDVDLALDHDVELARRLADRVDADEASDGG